MRDRISLFYYVLLFTKKNNNQIINSYKKTAYGTESRNVNEQHSSNH